MKAAVYARYSSDNQREESITAQISGIKEYCKRNNITIVKIYTDEAFSAKTDNRPQFLQMIKDSKCRAFDCVIVHKLDRFARNRYDSAFHKKNLKENGVKLISVLENLDESPESIILESVLQGMAEYFSANLSREVMKGLKQNAYQAKHTGGTPPLGYDVSKDKTYIINEKEALVVKEIFEMFCSGYGYGTIAKDMNNKNYTMKSGKQFGKTNIRDILMNEKYTGMYIYNLRLDGKNLHKFKPEEEIIRIPDGMPAIVSKELFYKVKEQINGKRIGKRMRVMNYLLTGKLFCGDCGFNYTGAGHYKGSDRHKENHHKYYIYACTKRRDTCENKPIRKDLIEADVIDAIKIRILNEKEIPNWVDRLSKKIEESQIYNKSRITEIKQEISKLKNQIDKDFQLFYDDLMDKTILAEKTNAKKLKINQK